MVPMHGPPEMGPALPLEAALTEHSLVVSSRKTRPWQVGEITSCSETYLGLPGKVPDTTFLPLLRASLPPSLQGRSRQTG